MDNVETLKQHRAAPIEINPIDSAIQEALPERRNIFRARVSGKNRTAAIEVEAGVLANTCTQLQHAFPGYLKAKGCEVFQPPGRMAAVHVRLEAGGRPEPRLQQSR